MHQKFIEQAIAFIQGESSYGDHLPYTSPSGHIQGNEFASRSHVSTQKGQNQRQHNSYKNQNVSHQSHGGRHNQEHVKQKWNLPRNFKEQGGFLAPSRGDAPEFVRPSPPIPSIYAQYIPVQPFYYPIAFAGKLTQTENINFVFYFLCVFSNAYVSLLRLATTDDVSST